MKNTLYIMGVDSNLEKSENFIFKKYCKKENGILSIKCVQASFSLVGWCFITYQPFWVI